MSQPNTWPKQSSTAAWTGIIGNNVQVTNSSELLAQARINHQRLPELPASIRPKTPSEAYVVQDGLIDQLLAHYGGEVIGYKVACTNITAQRQLNVDAPFCGRLLSAFFFKSP